jgi:hypothetical protein
MSEFPGMKMEELGDLLCTVEARFTGHIHRHRPSWMVRHPGRARDVLPARKRSHVLLWCTCRERPLRSANANGHWSDLRGLSPVTSRSLRVHGASWPSALTGNVRAAAGLVAVWSSRGLSVRPNLSIDTDVLAAGVRLPPVIFTLERFGRPHRN